VALDPPRPLFDIRRVPHSATRQFGHGIREPLGPAELVRSLAAELEKLADLRHSYEMVRHTSILTQSRNMCKDEVMK
jgi:hypothetical protein